MIHDEQFDIKKDQAPKKSYIKVNRELHTSYAYDIKKQINKIYASLPAQAAKELVKKVFERNEFTDAKGY